MPRYFFDIVDAGKLTRDEFGDDLAGDDEACDQAIALVIDIAQDRLPNGDQHEFVAIARDESGRAIYKASLAVNGWRPESC